MGEYENDFFSGEKTAYLHVLISHASKVLLCVISERLKNISLREIGQEQAGFREGRGTRDQSVNLHVLMEKYRDHNKHLFMCFIDYRKAFDCVYYPKLWKTMTSMGYPAHIVGLIESLYKDQKSAIRLSSGCTDFFHNGKGVRQGCILSPELFNCYTEMITRLALNEEDGVCVGGRRVSNLRYADDTVLLAESAENLQRNLNRMVKVSEEHGLHLNVKKTKSMVSGKTRCDLNLTCKGENIEQVSSFTYLGSEITENCESEADIRKRLAMSRNTMKNLTCIWADRGVQNDTKMRLLKALIWSIAIYGCEGWTIKAADKKRIEAFEMWCFRRLLRVSYLDRRSNEWILQQVGCRRELFATVVERKLRFLGHIVRKEQSIENQILTGRVDGKRSRGRQRRGWWDDAVGWLEMSTSEVVQRVRTRWKYRQLVRHARSWEVR